MEHPEFSRIISLFEQQANDALAAATEAHKLASTARTNLEAVTARLAETERLLAERSAALHNAGHRIADTIMHAADHIHDADTHRKQAFIDAARIARGVQLH